MNGLMVGVAIIAIFWTVPTCAESAAVLKGPPPKWVIAPPTADPAEPGKDAPIQIVSIDNQIRLSRKGQEQFLAQSFKILKPEALQAANIRMTWLPSHGTATVHAIRVRRADGSVTDMLPKAEFRIVQQEALLEQSVLSGLSTAVYNTPGVDVGDTVEFAVTITSRDPSLGDRTYGNAQLPLVDVGGTHRVRILQAEGVEIERAVSRDLTAPSTLLVQNPMELIAELRSPKSANLPTGAPERFRVARLLEFSSFGGMRDVSQTFWERYDLASKLAPNSPVRAEIKKIQAMAIPQEAKALAALKLVQDRIRYVFVGLGDGNLTPASADETWERRFGDCKGKTTLLMAILRELGIPAEAVLVSLSGRDDTADRLASPGLFDHVLVRASIGGKGYWLDGTQFNSPDLEHIPPPAFVFALPIRAEGSELEALPVEPLTAPTSITIRKLDATAGADKPAKVTLRVLLHGANVTVSRAAFGALAGDDLKKALVAILNDVDSDLEVEEQQWLYDDRTGVLEVRGSGTQKVDWENPNAEFMETTISGAGFIPPGDFKRPKEEDQAAPWAVGFPDFRCWITKMVLPPQPKKFRWTYVAKPVDRILAGTQYYRQATINGDNVQTVMSKRTVVREISAKEAAAVETTIPKFNNAISRVLLTQVGKDVGNTDDPRVIADVETLNRAQAAAMCRSNSIR